MMVGIMLPDITNSLFPPMIRGIESVLEPAGYASILVNTDNDDRREARMLQMLLNHGVDGIIDAAPSRVDPSIENREAGDVPIVTANRRVDAAGVPAVISDEASGIAAALRHLYDAGHRRIAHIAGSDALSTGVTRRRAFEETARALNLQLPEGAIVSTLRYDEGEGRRAAEALIDGDGVYTAFLCANDRLALGAIEALRDRGLNCPADVSVTGFNDIPLLDHISPGLTTVRILKFEVGRFAAELLLRMMLEPDSQVPSITTLPVNLVIRESVAAPRKAARDAEKTA
jgi:LacI family transcriptional regulator